MTPEEQMYDFLEPLRQAVSDFRKATFEFAKNNSLENYDRMIAHQREIFDFAKAHIKLPEQSNG